MEAEDLSLREMTEAERECIQRYLKKLRAKPLVPSILAIVVGTVMPVLLLFCIKEWSPDGVCKWCMVPEKREKE